MRRCRFLLLFLLAVPAARGAALQPSDFSEETRAFMPPRVLHTIVIESGTRYEGEVLSETETTVTVRLFRGDQSTVRTLLKGQLKSMERQSPTDLLATGILRRFQLRELSLPEADYEQGLRVMDEFLAKCPDATLAGDMRERRKALAAEYEQYQRGLRKVRANWVNPVELVVWQFVHHGRRMKEMEAAHRDIDKPAFKGDPKLREEYETLKEERRAASRELPSMMRDRLPLLLQDRQFHAAAGELTSFMHFILRMVLPATQEEREFRSFFGSEVWSQIDYTAVTRMQRHFMDAWNAAAPAIERPPAADKHPEMVYIPGGYFLMGDPAGKPGDDAFPLRIVFVSPFLLDRTEVPNRDYRRFHESVVRSGDQRYAHPLAPPMKEYKADGWDQSHLDGEDQPVVGIDWFDAYAYAKYAGKRLPTEAEWERAARGTNLWLYPWGDAEPGPRGVNTPDGRAHIAADIDAQKPPPPPQRGWFSCRKPPPPPPPTRLPATTWGVDSQLPASAERDENFIWEPRENNPFGLRHLTGNAAEWVADWYRADYYARSPVFNPEGPEPDDARAHVYRGGDYLSPKAELTCHWRGVPRTDHHRNGSRAANQPAIGVRCAVSLGVVENPIVESSIDKILADALGK